MHTHQACHSRHHCGLTLAEYGAPIQYWKGSNNVRADMLSRIHPMKKETSCDGIISALEEAEEVPWEFDGLERKHVEAEQRK